MSPEMCRADLKRLINEKLVANLLVAYIVVKFGIAALQFFNLFLKIAWRFSRKISNATNGHKTAAGQLV